MEYIAQNIAKSLTGQSVSCDRTSLVRPCRLVYTWPTYLWPVLCTSLSRNLCWSWCIDAPTFPSCHAPTQDSVMDVTHHESIQKTLIISNSNLCIDQQYKGNRENIFPFFLTDSIPCLASRKSYCVLHHVIIIMTRAQDLYVNYKTLDTRRYQKTLHNGR